MVQKIFNALNKEISSIHGVAYLLGFFALIAQILALVRDRMLAGAFGAGTTLDIYYAAFRIPDLIFVTVASLVSISILVPIMTNVMDDKERLQELINSIFIFFFSVIVFVSLVVFIILPYITPKLFPGITGDDMQTLINLSRILLLSPIFLGLSNFFASIIQLHNRFFLYALSPILYNIGIIGGLVFLYPIWGLYGLVIGVCFGAFMHLGVQIPYIISEGRLPKIKTKIDYKEVLKIAILSIPRTVTLSAGSISIFFLISTASLIGAGAISIFNFSFNLQTAPLSIIGVSYASAIFPVLSRLYVEGKRSVYLEKMISVTKHIIFWSLPATALFIVLRAQIVRTVLGTGNFGWSDTRLTAAAVAIFAISMIPQSLILIFVRAFYSEGKTKKPLILNVISMFATILLAYLFLYIYQNSVVFSYFIQSLFRIEDVQGSAVTMLALAYTVGVSFNVLLHWIAFEKEYPSYTRSVLRNIFQSFSASVILGLVSYRMLDVFDNFFNINTVIGIFLQGLFSGLVGLSVGVLVLRLLKSKELDEVWKTLHRKIWKVDKNEVVLDKLL